MLGVDWPMVAVLAVASFLPPIALVVWVRNLERHRREPLRVVLGLMLYGATLGVVAAIALTRLWDGVVGDRLVLGFPEEFFAIVLLAPPLEELSKGLGLRLARDELDEPEDGLVHGAAIGLGFAATENLAYGMITIVRFGLPDALATVALRVVSSTILHAGTSATLGFAYGLWRQRLAHGAILPALFLVAVAEHALYNGLVVDHSGSGALHLAGFALAVLLAVINGIVLARVVRSLDADGAPPPIVDARTQRAPDRQPK